MNYFLKYGVTAILVSLCLNTTAQIKELPNLTREGLIADYRLAMQILKEQHPNPYKFIDSATLERKVDSLIKKAAEQNNVFAALQYSPIQLIRDVHTNFRWSDDNTKEIYRTLNFFPFPIMIERGKMLVNIKGGEIPYAAELVSINKQPVKDIINSLTSFAYSDGLITTGTDRMYSNFQMVMSLRNYDLKNYEIEFLDPASKSVKKLSMASSTPTRGFHSGKLSVIPVNQLQRAYWIFDSYEDATKTGMLTVNSFNLDESYAYKEFSTFFKEVNKRGYKQVIIDIRNNGGGNPAISALLYSFLSAKPFHNVYNYRARTIDIAYPEYAIADGSRKMSDDDIRNNKNFLYQRFDKDSVSGFYIGNARLKEGQLENFPPDKDAFNGNVYVLTGGGTVSAATYFASLVQKNKRGLIVGKETGSGEQATTAAWFLNYLLPHTKSILTIPISELYFFNSTTDNGRGVLPDKEMPMEKFIGFVRSSEDPELSYTMELINGGSK
ncbi:S41 family peptidase [Flavitalea flava]